MKTSISPKSQKSDKIKDYNSILINSDNISDSKIKNIINSTNITFSNINENNSTIIDRKKYSETINNISIISSKLESSGIEEIDIFEPKKSSEISINKTTLITSNIKKFESINSSLIKTSVPKINKDDDNNNRPKISTISTIISKPKDDKNFFSTINSVPNESFNSMTNRLLNSTQIESSNINIADSPSTVPDSNINQIMPKNSSGSKGGLIIGIIIVIAIVFAIGIFVVIKIVKVKNKKHKYPDTKSSVFNLRFIDELSLN